MNPRLISLRLESDCHWNPISQAQPNFTEEIKSSAFENQRPAAQSLCPIALLLQRFGSHYDAIRTAASGLRAIMVA
jgi:hypothetical protein